MYAWNRLMFVDVRYIIISFAELSHRMFNPITLVLDTHVSDVL